MLREVGSSLVNAIKTVEEVAVILPTRGCRRIQDSRIKLFYNSHGKRCTDGRDQRERPPLSAEYQFR